MKTSLLMLTLFLATVYSQKMNFVYRISEEQETGFKVGTVATDTGLHAKFSTGEIERLRYSIQSVQNAADSMFAIDDTTSQLTTTSVIDRDTLCANSAECEIEFDVMVYLVDPDTSLYDLNTIIRVTVIIEDINDNPPIFEESSVSLTVPESPTIGQVLVTSPAYDLDTGANNSVQTYEMIPDEGVFEIMVRNNVGGGQDLGIVVKQELDRERRERYNFDIVARDGGNPQKSGSVAITIQVTDVNDNKPTFKQSTFEVSVSEDFQVQEAILKLEAEDDDAGENGAMMFFFNSRTSQKNRDTFEIDRETGEIYPIKKLDFEDESEYRFLVGVRDKGSSPKSSEAEVIIHVTDVNDNAPQIIVKDNSVKLISEDAETDTFVAIVNVMDADSEQNGEVECTVSDDHFRTEKFSFQYHKILLKEKLDYEDINTYVVNITCTDKGLVPKSNSTAITVKVVDVNDNAPMFDFNEYKAYMSENNEPNNLIMTLTAVDIDGDDNNEVSYAIVEAEQDLVYIDTDNGDVRTKKSIDREMYSSFKFKVEARDNGSPAQSSFVIVTVIVDDVNDEGPKFTKPHFEFEVPEGRPITTSVGTLQAIDRDASPTFLYSLIDNDVAEVFTINSANGEILTLKRLDRVMQNRYDFSVMVRDGQIMSFNDTATVTVKIVEDTSIPPTILYPLRGNNSMKVPYDVAIGDTIVFVRAENMAADQRIIKFFIEHGNEDGFFKLDENHGNLTIAKAMALEDAGKYKLLISSYFENNPSQKSFVTLDIIITSPPAPEEESQGYIIIVVVIVCVTVVLAGAILLAICMMKRVDRERRESQRRKREEQKNYQMANIEKIARASTWEAEKQLKVMVKPTVSFKEEKNKEKKKETTVSITPTIIAGKKNVQFADDPVTKVEDDVSNLSGEADSGHGGSEEDFNSNGRYLFLHSDSDSSQQLSPSESFTFRPDSSILSNSSLKEWLVETPRRVNLPHKKEELQRSYSTDNYCLQREIPRDNLTPLHHGSHDRLALNRHSSYTAGVYDNFPSNRRDGMPSNRHDSMPSNQQDGRSLSRHDNFPPNRHDSMTSTPRDNFHYESGSSTRHDSVVFGRSDNLPPPQADNISSDSRSSSNKTSSRGSQKSVRFNVEEQIDDSEI